MQLPADHLGLARAALRILADRGTAHAAALVCYDPPTGKAFYDLDGGRSRPRPHRPPPRGTTAVGPPNMAHHTPKSGPLITRGDIFLAGEPPSRLAMVRVGAGVVGAVERAGFEVTPGEAGRAVAAGVAPVRLGLGRGSRDDGRRPRRDNVDSLPVDDHTEARRKNLDVTWRDLPARREQSCAHAVRCLATHVQPQVPMLGCDQATGLAGVEGDQAACGRKFGNLVYAAGECGGSSLGWWRSRQNGPKVRYNNIPTSDADKKADPTRPL